MRRQTKKAGITLIELNISMLIVLIIIVAAGTILVDSHRGWVDSWDIIYGGAADDAAIAQVAFERIVRKASRSQYRMNDTDELKVYYYQDWDDSEYPDRYARFYRSDEGGFYVEHGGRGENDAEWSTSTIHLCTTVENVEFKPVNGGIQMELVLDDGRQTTATVTTALLHNE